MRRGYRSRRNTHRDLGNQDVVRDLRLELAVKGVFPTVEYEKLASAFWCELLPPLVSTRDHPSIHPSFIQVRAFGDKSVGGDVMEVMSSIESSDTLMKRWNLAEAGVVEVVVGRGGE